MWQALVAIAIILGIACVLLWLWLTAPPLTTTTTTAVPSNGDPAQCDINHLELCSQENLTTVVHNSCGASRSNFTQCEVACATLATGDVCAWLNDVETYRQECQPYFPLCGCSSTTMNLCATIPDLKILIGNHACGADCAAVCTEWHARESSPQDACAYFISEIPEEEAYRCYQYLDCAPLPPPIPANAAPLVENEPWFNMAELAQFQVPQYPFLGAIQGPILVDANGAPITLDPHGRFAQGFLGSQVVSILPRIPALDFNAATFLYVTNNVPSAPIITLQGFSVRQDDNASTLIVAVTSAPFLLPQLGAYTVSINGDTPVACALLGFFSTPWSDATHKLTCLFGTGILPVSEFVEVTMVLTFTGPIRNLSPALQIAAEAWAQKIAP